MFPIDLQRLGSHKAASELLRIIEALMRDLHDNSVQKAMKFSHDQLTVQCIVPKLSKTIVDEIDVHLGSYYGFTNEELDFIINYDIKYRMGIGQGGAPEEASSTML